MIPNHKTESALEIPLKDHLEDLRSCLIKIVSTISLGMIAAFFFHREMILFISRTIDEKLVLLTPLEGLSVAFKLSFWAGLVGTSCIWILFLLRFIAPGLNKQEQKIAIPAICTSLILLTAGASFGYFVTLPLANAYILSFNSALGVNFWSLSSYIDYTAGLLFANAIAFELGGLLLLLIHFQVLEGEFLKRQRKLAIVLIFILSAILTPPDVVSQILMAIPLIALYEGAILWAKFKLKKS